MAKALGNALAAGLLLAALAGCSTMTPTAMKRNELYWDAARECQFGLASLRVDRIDGEGRVWYTLMQGSQTDVPKFLECYRRMANEKLRAAGIIQSGATLTTPAPAPSSNRQDPRPAPAPTPSTLNVTPSWPVAVPFWKPGYEWAYRWQSPQGSGTFVWVMTREDVVDGVPVYVISSGRRETLYRRSDLALYLVRVNGAIETRWAPPLMMQAWPLGLGQTWDQTYTRERPTERQTEVRSLQCQTSDAEEQITVPAGTFRAVKITCRFKPANNLSHELWYSPQVGHTVRERTYFSYGVRERELTQYKAP
jgi:hypothetical protein